MTPESKNKALVSKMLRELGEGCWHFMPVPFGYGIPTLDYIGAANGMSFAIETKAPGGKLTPRQKATIERMRRAKICVFVIDNPDQIPYARSVLEDMLNGRYVCGGAPIPDRSAEG